MNHMTKIIVAGLIVGTGLGLWVIRTIPGPTNGPQPANDMPPGPDTTVQPPVLASVQQAAEPIESPDPGQDWGLFRGSQGLLGVSSEQLPETLDLLWSFKTEAPVRSSAVVQKGRVYIGSADSHLYAIDLETGQKIWSLEVDSPIEAPPTVLEDTVYVADLGGFVYAVNTESGETRWTYETDGEVAGAVNWARLGERLCVLVSSHDAFVHCIDAKSGEIVWQFETESFVNGTPAVSGDLCVFGGCDAFVYVLRLADANELMRIDMGAYVASSVVLDQSRIYAGNYDGLFLSASISDPNERWEYPVEDGQIVSSAAVGPDAIVFGDRDSQVTCLDRDTGDERWTFKTLDNVDSSPVIVGDKVVVGSDDGRLYMLSYETGEKIWSYEIGQPIISSPAVSHGRVIIGCDDGSVYAFGTKSGE